MCCDLAGGLAGEAEGAAFGVAAHGPALAWMHDGAAEGDDPLERARQIVDPKIGEREPVARTGAALVEAEGGTIPVALDALALRCAAFGERQPEQPFPKLLCPREVVGWELRSKPSGIILTAYAAASACAGTVGTDEPFRSA